MFKKAKEISSGAVVFRKYDNGYRVVLAHKRKLDIWCLPKGKMEAGETREQTALREVEEETGVKGQITAYLDEVHYNYTDKRRGLALDKTVYFFLMEYGSGNFDSHDHEMDMVSWFDLGEAKKIAGYKSERRILELAFRALQTKEQ